VWSWGRNNYGQLGNDTTVQSNVPVQVIGLTGVTSIAGGGFVGYALKSDGTVWSWGYNDYGGLGNDTTVQSNVPVQVIGLTGVTSIAGGFDNCLALKSDGTVWSWGNNLFGELGNNTTVQSNVPVQVIGLTGVTSIARGDHSGYAIKSDGTVWSWGNNSNGQLGNNSDIDSHIPVQVYNFSGIAIPSSPTVLQVSNIATNFIELSWSTSSGATGYHVKRATATGGPYTTISASVTTPNYIDTTVTNGTTYYYVVTAVSTNGESGNSNEVNATPTEAVTPPVATGNKAILEITMTTGSIKEFDLTAEELQDFITWYDGRSNGAAKAYYIFTKKNNIKPFLDRKEYIAFDKISSFEVKDYNE